MVFLQTAVGDARMGRCVTAAHAALQQAEVPLMGNIVNMTLIVKAGIVIVGFISVAPAISLNHALPLVAAIIITVQAQPPIV